MEQELVSWWRGWQTYLQEMFAVGGIWLELLGENGEATHILNSYETPNRTASATEERFPVISRMGHLGWLVISNDMEGSDLRRELTNLLPLIGQSLAGELERIRLVTDNQSLIAQHRGVFENLALLLGLRNHETESHTRRVEKVVMQFVEYLGLPSEQHEAIRQGALLHDIGKLGIPDAILLKPGSLTLMERRMMELHVVYGHRVLSSFTNQRTILDIILHHHERWDGSGYPDHLRGEQIPLVARLFAVVDVYDALISDRPYRTAWAPTLALNYLKDQAGQQFDPEMVKAFLEMIT